MSWNDDIKKIIELIPKIDAIYDELNKKIEPESRPNETEEIKRKINELNDKIAKLDKLYKKRLDSALKTYTEITNNGN